MKRVAWAIVALAGCRLGFDRIAPGGDAGDDAAAGDAVELRLVTDAYGNDAAGQPIAGATVLVDRGHGLERSMTDADGAARIPIADLAAIHVVFRGELGLRVYSVIAPPPGPIELGGRPGAAGFRQAAVRLPDTMATEYTARIAEHCATLDGGGSGFVVAISLAPECDGQARHVVGFQIPVSSGVYSEYLDGGVVTLAAGTIVTLGGTFRAMRGYPVTLDHLAPTASATKLTLVERTDLDVLPLSPALDFTATPMATAALTTHAAPGGNAVKLSFTNLEVAGNFLTISDSILPLDLTKPIALDAARLVPPFASLAVGARELSWVGGDGGTIAIVEAIAGPIQWDAYLPASATSVEFPALPADLGASFLAFDVVSVQKLDVPGATRAGLQATVDRTWGRWPHEASLLPAAGSTLASILYSAGIVFKPPPTQ